MSTRSYTSRGMHSYDWVCVCVNECINSVSMLCLCCALWYRLMNVCGCICRVLKKKPFNVTITTIETMHTVVMWVNNSITRKARGGGNLWRQWNQIHTETFAILDHPSPVYGSWIIFTNKIYILQCFAYGICYHWNCMNNLALPHVLYFCVHFIYHLRISLYMRISVILYDIK